MRRLPFIDTKLQLRYLFETMKERSFLKTKCVFPVLRSLLACAILVCTSVVVTHLHHHVADDKGAPVAASDCPVCVLSHTPHTGAVVISSNQELSLTDWSEIIELQSPRWNSISSLGIAPARAPPFGSV